MSISGLLWSLGLIRVKDFDVHPPIEFMMLVDFVLIHRTLI